MSIIMLRCLYLHFMMHHLSKHLRSAARCVEVVTMFTQTILHNQLLRPFSFRRFSIIMTTKPSSAARDALAETNETGKFVRTAAGFREIISKEHEEFKPEFDRYHLYISLACPWANRCLVALKLKGLNDCIKHTVVHPTWQKTRPNDENDKHHGWAFFQSGNICIVLILIYMIYITLTVL